MVHNFLKWLSSTSGLEVIHGNQNSPRPARPYITIYHTNISAHGQDEASYVDQDDEQTVHGIRLYNVSIQLIGDPNEGPLSATTRLTEIRNNVRASRLVNGLGEVFSILQDSQILNTTSTLDSEYTPQATWDVILAVQETTSLAQDSIQSFEVSFNP